MAKRTSLFKRRHRMRRNTRLHPIPIQVVDQLANIVTQAIYQRIDSGPEAMLSTATSNERILNIAFDAENVVGEVVEVNFSVFGGKRKSKTDFHGEFIKARRAQTGEPVYYMSVFLNHDHPWSFYVTPESTARIRATIAHELTHAYDVFSMAGQPEVGDPRNPRPEWIRWYVNTRHEVAARLRQIFMEIHDEVVQRVSEGDSLGPAITKSLEKSLFWNYYLPILGKRGRDRTLKALVTEFEHEGLSF